MTWHHAGWTEVAGAILKIKKTSTPLSLSSWVTIAIVVTVLVTTIAMLVLVNQYSRDYARGEAEARLGQLAWQVQVDSDKIFIQDGALWTSAGISAGIDLALALVEQDLGQELAHAVAREMVVYYRRPGGQSQFSSLLEMEPPSGRIRQALRYAREHLHEALSAERLAEIACLSRRQFDRAFSAETGQTPAKAIERLRAEAARVRVENSDESLEGIARMVGFADPERMRRAFLRLFGQPPQALRRASRNG